MKTKKNITPRLDRAGSQSGGGTYYVFTLPGLGSREEKFLGTLKVRSSRVPDYLDLLDLAKKRFGVREGLAIRDRYRYSPFRVRPSSSLKH